MKLPPVDYVSPRSINVVIWLLSGRQDALLADEPHADADRIRKVLSGNLCRCTSYIPIVEAVVEATAAYARSVPPA